MPLQPASTINLKRNKVVRWINSFGKSQNAVVRAVTGTTLTLWLPSEHRQITTATVATTPEGAGWHHRI
jgi:hypothetical protein